MLIVGYFFTNRTKKLWVLMSGKSDLDSGKYMIIN